MNLFAPPQELDNLCVCHAGFGTVWVFSRLGEPLYRVRSCAGLTTTNLAYGGPDNRHIFITESETGAKLPRPGRPMFSHAAIGPPPRPDRVGNND